jgi:hypothetical protein
MRRLLRNSFAIVAVAAIASAVAACSSDNLSNITNMQLLPRVDQLAKPDWLSYSGGKEEFALRPVIPTDLVSPDGQCAAPATAAPATSDVGAGGPIEGAPLVAGGIALQMTECDVVLRAGPPEQMDLGTNERGDRAVVITYIRGNRPGVYRFAGGRLYSIERPPGPPPAESKQKGKAKKART